MIEKTTKRELKIKRVNKNKRVNKLKKKKIKIKRVNK